MIKCIKVLFLFVTINGVWAQSFTNGAGDNDFSNPSNWDIGTFPSSSQTALVNSNGVNKAILTSEVSSVGALRVGVSGSGELDINSNGLIESVNASGYCLVGLNSGDVGLVNQNSGTVVIGSSLNIGKSGTGTWNLNGGVLKVTRGEVSLGQSGSGVLNIKGGGLHTRTGVYVKNGGEFIVEGSESHFIALGSNSTIDGFWSQSSGGKLTLKLDDRGVTPIEVMYVDGTGSNGDVTFESGAILDVSFLTGVDVSGSWDVMHWEGTLTDNGLAFESSVDQSKWSFTFEDTDSDGNDDVLRLHATSNGSSSAMGVPYSWYDTYFSGLSSSSSYDQKDTEDSDGDGLVNYLEYFSKTDPLDSGIVTDLASVKKYMNHDDVNIKLQAGVYQVSKEDLVNYEYKIHPEKYSYHPFFAFKGSNSTYDFTGVKIEMSTYYYAYPGFGGSFFDGLIGMEVIGDNNYIKGLTWEDLDDEYSGQLLTSVHGNIAIEGTSNTVENFILTSRSSYPYGYGSYFGVGGPWTINPVKHSAVLIRGVSNQLLNSQVYSRSFGHGIYIQGATTPIVSGCYVEGVVRTTDDMLAETEGPAFDVGFVTSYDDVVLQSGLMSSLSEDGIRVYKNGLDYETGTTDVAVTSDVTISNCSIKHMRTGVTIPFSTGTQNVVSNCTSIGTQLGGFIPGSNNTFTNCTADAVYGPALLYFYANINNSVIDVDVISRDQSEYYGNDIIAYIAGSSNDITLNEIATACSEHTFGRVMVSGDNEMFYFTADTTKQDVAASSNTVSNNTQYPVYLGTQATSNTINLDTSYSDNGSSNSINATSLSVSACCSATNQNAYSTLEAESYCEMDGINTGTSTVIGGHITSIEETNWALYGNIDFGTTSPTGIEISAGSNYAGGYVDVYIDELYGEKLASVEINNTGNWQTYEINLAEISSSITGVHDIYLSFQGTSGTYLYNIDHFVFLSEVNLALSGSASQSSDNYTTSGQAQLAIDGNTDGVFGNSSVTHTQSESNAWWQVDLGSDISIGAINIFNRTDCCASRLSNFTVSVINSSGTTTYSQTYTTEPDPSTSLNAGNAIGSIVKIELNGSNFLSLAEVEVYAGVNLALSGTASQSSNNYTTSGHAQLAIDGNTDGVLGNSSVTHTQSESNAWWQVDLGSDISIGAINIFNRTDCCASRLSNFTVSVINSSGTTTYSQTYTTEPDPSTSLNAGNAIGSIVKIQLNGSNFLSLAEVEVYAGVNTSKKVSLKSTIVDNFDITAYPNPFTSSLTIDASNTSETIGSIQLVDLSGRVIVSENKGNTISNLDDINSGLYLVLIRNLKGQILSVQKVVKK